MNINYTKTPYDRLIDRDGYCVNGEHTAEFSEGVLDLDGRGRPFILAVTRCSECGGVK